MDKINDIDPSEFRYALAYLNYLSRVGWHMNMGHTYRTHPDGFRRPMPRDYGCGTNRARAVRLRVEAMIRFSFLTVSREDQRHVANAA